MKSLPHARPLPLVQAPPAGDTGAETKLGRQVLPGDAGVQDEQDPLQRLPIGQALAARVAKAALLLRHKRLDQFPELVRDDPRRGGHRHPSQLDDGCRRLSPSGSGSLHSEMTSKRS